MNPLLVAASAVAGGGVGLGCGLASVWLERIEKLEQEEGEERLEYERDVAALRSKAEQAGEAATPAEPWLGERYGWTRLERGVAPALGAVGFAAFVAHGPLDYGLLIHLLWITVFVHIVVFDLKHRLILNRVTYPAIVIALALSPVSPGLNIERALIGCAAVALFFFLQNLVSRGSIGLGDAKLGALVGAVTGAGPDSHFGAAYATIYAIFLGGATALLLLVTRVRSLKDPIPYGPFLCAGAAIILFQGP